MNPFVSVSVSPFYSIPCFTRLNSDVDQVPVYVIKSCLRVTRCDDQLCQMDEFLGGIAMQIVTSSFSNGIASGNTVYYGKEGLESQSCNCDVITECNERRTEKLFSCSLDIPVSVTRLILDQFHWKAALCATRCPLWQPNLATLVHARSRTTSSRLQ